MTSVNGESQKAFCFSILWGVLVCFFLSLVVPSLSHVLLFATPWMATCQASLSFTISHSLLKLTSTESVMPPNHLILCHPLPLLPSISSSIRVFSNESALRIRWPQYLHRCAILRDGGAPSTSWLFSCFTSEIILLYKNS